MAKKYPKSSGLDIEGLMTDIDNSESIQKRSDDLAELLRRTNQAIENQVKLLGLANDKVEELKECCKALLNVTSNLNIVYEKLNEAIEEAHHIKIEATLNDTSIEILKQLHKKFLESEKTQLDALAKSRESQINSFRRDFSEALNEKGFWCSQKTFMWLAGIFFFSVFTILLEITLFLLKLFGLI